MSSPCVRQLTHNNIKSNNMNLSIKTSSVSIIGALMDHRSRLLAECISCDQWFGGYIPVSKNVTKLRCQTSTCSCMDTSCFTSAPAFECVFILVYPRLLLELSRGHPGEILIRHKTQHCNLRCIFIITPACSVSYNSARKKLSGIHNSMCLQGKVLSHWLATTAHLCLVTSILSVSHSDSVQ